MDLERVCKNNGFMTAEFKVGKYCITVRGGEKCGSVFVWDTEKRSGALLDLGSALLLITSGEVAIGNGGDETETVVKITLEDERGEA